MRSRRPWLTEEEKQEIIKLDSEGVRKTDICKQIGRSETVVYRVLDKAKKNTNVPITTIETPVKRQYNVKSRMIASPRVTLISCDAATAITILRGLQ